MGNLLKDLQITEFGRGIELGKNGIWRGKTRLSRAVTSAFDRLCVSRTAGAPDIPVISIAFAATEAVHTC